jgi:hypothetical protein
MWHGPWRTIWTAYGVLALAATAVLAMRWG